MSENIKESVDKKNAKCPFCGGELYVKYTKGGGFCPYCKKEFDCEKAVKLYDSLHAEQSEPEKKVARGEDYLEVDRALDRAEFYLKNKQFEGAEKEFNGALALTDTDYRVYFGMVRVKTKNLTDYNDQTHKEWLEKALACADSEEKIIIKRLYGEYYQVSKLSDDERLQYKIERNAAVKIKLEQKLKDLIPKYMKVERGLKTRVIIGAIFVALGLGTLLWGMFGKTDFLAVCGVAALAGGYLFVRSYFLNKKQNAMFNAVLDVYDALPDLSLDPDAYFELLELLKACIQPFMKKNSLYECEELLSKISDLLFNKGGNDAVEFVAKNRVLSDFIEKTGENEEND